MKILLVLMVSLGLLVGIAMESALAASFTYDHTADYSSVSNPNGPWSYRYAEVGDPNSSSALLTDHGYIPDPSIWGPYSDWELVGSNGWHPGTYADTIIAFDLPDILATSNVTVDLAFGDGDPDDGSDGQHISFSLNDTILESWTLDSTFSGFSYSTVINNMSTTDIAYIRINKIGTVNWDGVYVSATFSGEVPSTPVPEPVTIALLGIGLAGLAGAEIRRRRKKRAVDKS